MTWWIRYCYHPHCLSSFKAASILPIRKYQRHRPISIMPVLSRLLVYVVVPDYINPSSLLSSFCLQTFVSLTSLPFHTRVHYSNSSTPYHHQGIAVLRQIWSTSCCQSIGATVAHCVTGAVTFGLRRCGASLPSCSSLRMTAECCDTTGLNVIT